MKEPDPYEEMAANMFKLQDDVVIYSVRKPDGELMTVMEKRHNVELVCDPETGGVMPITVCNLIYDVDDNGEPIVKVTGAGICEFGCKVKVESLSECRICRSGVCRKHRFQVGEVAFCKKTKCRILGRLWQVLHLLYRLLSFCVRSVGLRESE